MSDSVRKTSNNSVTLQRSPRAAFDHTRNAFLLAWFEEMLHRSTVERQQDVAETVAAMDQLSRLFPPDGDDHAG